MAMKLHDVGEKSSMHEPRALSKNTVWYPTLRFDTKQIPDLKSFKHKDSVVLEIKGTISGVDGHNNEPKHFTIDVKKAGVAKGSKSAQTEISKELGV